MLTVKTFGKFEVQNENGTFDQDTIRSAMLIKLLLYFLLHREQPLSREEIAEAIWHEGETDNPLGALKNLTYRLRGFLEKELGKADYILTERGSYRWNPEIMVTVDVEEYLALTAQGQDTERPVAERIAAYEQALALYDGDFMTKVLDLHWVMTLSAYYHSLFLQHVKELSALYIQEEQYDNVERLCTEALRVDRVDEEIHANLVLSYVRRHQPKLAVDSYEAARDILCRELGIRNSEILSSVYEEILKMDYGEQVSDLKKVQDELTEENPKGAYLCSYPVFHAIYQLEARRLERLGVAEYVVLLTVDPVDIPQVENADQLRRFRINQATEKLEPVIRDCLRTGDIATKCSDSQYMVLLPGCDYEHACMVAERMVEGFRKAYRLHKNVKINISLEEVAPENDRVAYLPNGPETEGLA